MDLGQIIIFFAITVAYVMALVQSVFYLIECEYRAPDGFDKLCIGASLLLGTFFCLVAIDLVYRMFL